MPCPGGATGHSDFVTQAVAQSVVRSNRGNSEAQRVGCESAAFTLRRTRRAFKILQYFFVHVIVIVFEGDDKRKHVSRRSISEQHLEMYGTYSTRWWIGEGWKVQQPAAALYLEIGGKSGVVLILEASNCWQRLRAVAINSVDATG